MMTPKLRSGGAILGVCAVLLAIAATVDTTVLFIFPIGGSTRGADAIVVLDGAQYRDRLELGISLARDGAATTLAVSTTDPFLRHCAAPTPGITVICFRPVPDTTQGEARELGALEARHGWRSVILVTSRFQATRARLRSRRCFSGRISVATITPPLPDWPYDIAYEWGATAKAMLLQRSC
jgi:uncharacterized SAM-binding protein YcdF (DUF218 family)